MDVAKLKEQARVSWGKGDYSGLSQMLAPAATALADACAVSAGQEVLDVAAGDGNFALVAAAEGASVTASDLAPGMVEAGRARSQAEGFDIDWLEADAEALPFEDRSFDCVGSVFGAMLAPRPRVMAEELFRVLRPGGTVGMTVWTDSGPTYDMFAIGRSYAPPSDAPRLEEWSREDVIRERFDGLAGSLQISRTSLPWSADSPEDFVTGMERHAPQQVAAKEAMPPDVYAELRAKMLALARDWAGGDGPFEIQAEYVLIVARRPG